MIVRLRQFTATPVPQWDGRTVDGRTVYVRLDGSDVSMGVGESWKRAVRSTKPVTDATMLSNLSALGVGQ